MPTYGPSGTPSSSTFNYNAVMTATMGEYRSTFKDNVTRKSALLSRIRWQKEPGALYLKEKLMYAIAPTDTYDGYDELSLAVTDGLTEAQFDWAQTATPCGISGKEKRMNKTREIDLVKFKIKQAELSVQDFWPKALLRGSMHGTGSDIREPYTSSVNGSTYVIPLPRMVMYDPTASYEIGGINQSTKTWWQNQTYNGSTITTKESMVDALIEFKNNLSRGVGGNPDLFLCDQWTWQLIHKAYRVYYNNTAPSFNDIPFENINFWGTPIIWDEFVPDVYANSGAGSLDCKNGKGTLYGLNLEFLRFVSEEDTDFTPGDWEKPANQDAQFKHILWMGGFTCSNRFKQGVMGNIPRTLS